jgi:serine/threonine-protein kinase
VERAIHIAAQICEGLSAAHAQDVVHRDLKPANVMLVRGAGAEITKLLDFGLARSLRGDMSMLTETGVMFGTPTYMPPEVARGENCDARGDLYALGVMLFEMLSGAPPFGGSHALALAMQHASADPPPLPQAVPAPLSHLVRRLLAKEPADRPASASATRTLLMACLDQVRTPAQPSPSISALERVELPARSPWPWVTAGALLLGGIIWWAWPTTNPVARDAPPSVAPQTHDSERPASVASKAPVTPASAASEAPVTAASVASDAPRTAASVASKAPETQPPIAAPTTRPRVRRRAPATRPRMPATRAPVTAAPASAAPASAKSKLPGAFIRP